MQHAGVKGEICTQFWREKSLEKVTW